jgi:hypothetical protein
MTFAHRNETVRGPADADRIEERTRSSVGFATYLLPLRGEPCGRIKRPKTPAVIANHSEYFLKE